MALGRAVQPRCFPIPRKPAPAGRSCARDPHTQPDPLTLPRTLPRTQRALGVTGEDLALLQRWGNSRAGACESAGGDQGEGQHGPAVGRESSGSSCYL